MADVQSVSLRARDLWQLSVGYRWGDVLRSSFCGAKSVSATPFLAATSWYHYLLRWDSVWYANIINEGYKYNGNDLVQQPVAFYPLYPLITKALTIFTGINSLLALLVVANVAGVLSVLALFKYVRHDYNDEIAYLTVAFLSFFPTSFYMSAGYAESLALFLILCFFLLLKQEQYIFAAVFAGLTFATRSTGIVLLPVIAWELWCRFGSDRRRFFSYALVCSIIATSGLWLYMIYLWSAFDSPFAFAHDVAAWGAGGFGHNFISALLLEGLIPLRFPVGPNKFGCFIFLTLF